MSDSPDISVELMEYAFGGSSIDAFDDSENTPAPQRIEELRPTFSADMDQLVELTLEVPDNLMQAQFFLENFTYFVAELVTGRNVPGEVKHMLYGIVSSKIDVDHEDAREFLALIDGVIFGNVLASSTRASRGTLSEEMGEFLARYALHSDSLFQMEDLTSEVVLEIEPVLPRPASAESIRAARDAYFGPSMSFSVHEVDDDGMARAVSPAVKVYGETRAALIEALSSIPEMEVEPYVEPVPKVPANLASMFVDLVGHLPEPTDRVALRIWEKIQNMEGGIISMEMRNREVQELASSGRVGRVATEVFEDDLPTNIEPAP